MKPIENIFDSRKCKEKKKFKIIVDTREKNSLVIASLIEQEAEVIFENLEVADYLIGEIAIERKTFSDFISSMISKRLLRQLIDLKKYPKQFLILEGFNFNYSLKNENVVRGMILSTILRFNVPIIYTENEEDTAKFLAILAKKKDNKPVSLRQSRTFKTIGEQKQFILEGFPEIGPVTAKKLLKKHKTLNKIFSLTEEELKEDINPKKTEKFRKLLDF